MSTKYITLVEDDFGGQGEAQTVRFGLDGKDYLIDLNDDNRKKFHDAIGKYVQAARPSEFAEKVRRNTRSSKRTQRATTSPKSRETATASPKVNAAVTPMPAPSDHRNAPHHPTIREWAKANGYKIGERGRVPQIIHEQYDVAMRDLDAALAG